MLTVLAWFWRQEKSRAVYTAEHVNIWAHMVRRNLSMPHRICCVTDDAEGIEPWIEIIRPPGDFLDITNPRWSNGKPQCYRRLSMFRRDAAEIFGERFVCMDLDSVIGGPLDPLFERDEDLVLFRGTHRRRPYNGSMMLIRAGCRPDLFEDFNQAVALESGGLYCGSDQAWLMHKLGPDMPVWDDRDGVHWYRSFAFRCLRGKVPRLMFFPGSIKPWDAVHLDKFTREHYRADLKEAA